MRTKYRHIILSQDFFPAVGGAHHWLYEVYSRWPEQVVALVTDYSMQQSLSERQLVFDQSDHGRLSITRHHHVFEELHILSLRFWCKIWQIHNLIRQKSAHNDVMIHCLRAYPEGFVAALYKRLHGNKPRIATYAHGEEILTAQTSRQLNWMATSAYKAADYVIANSHSTENLLKDFCDHPNIHIVHPGVNLCAFICTEKEVEHQRQQWGVSTDDIVLLSISRMEPRKNHARVLKAVAELRSLGLPVVYVAASDGEEKPVLQQLANDLGIAEHVHFPGYIDDRERGLYFSAADIHVQPSIQSGSMIEGYGIVFIEAAAAGLPSIAGDIGGQEEAVLDGETGFVVDGTDQKQLIYTIKNLAQSPGLRKQMGEAGRVWAGKNNWEQIAEQIELLLRDV